MGLTDFWIKNYRSVKSVWLKLRRVNVFVGPNGCGKSNLYRAIYLMSTTANGQFARALAEEGGIESILWCGDYGKKDRGTVSLSVKFDDFQFDFECGPLPERVALVDSAFSTTAGESLFIGDAEIKSECLYRLKGKGSKSALLQRGRAAVTARDVRGEMTDYTMRVGQNESILAGLREPEKYPYLSQMRMEFLNWRFYHHFRTDRDSPLRRPQLPVMTEIMAHDGSDFISVLGTILEIGDGGGLLGSLNDAFPGSNLAISNSRSGLRLKLYLPGFQRPFDASELSDGTLQYLCLLAAIYSPRPPSVLAINEPETSIHSDLFEPLARMLSAASKNSQIWLTTHSKDLAMYMEDFSGYPPQELEKVDGETKLVGVGLGGYREDIDD